MESCGERGVPHVVFEAARADGEVGDTGGEVPYSAEHEGVDVGALGESLMQLSSQLILINYV